MRYQGRITSWKDDQGFGFITPNAGGRQVFVHVKSFSHRQRRPVGNEIVTYELKTDSRGRPQAENVAFVGRIKLQATSAGPGNGSVAFAVFFLALVTGAVVAGKLPLAVLTLYLAASAVAFVAYARDKSAAKNDGWRTPESTLHIFGLVGGWPGGLVAQRVFRHKSKKQSFQVAFWITVALNCSALGWFFSSSGARTLKSVLGLE